jgi:probable HAF family extracellular repeat protein
MGAQTMRPTSKASCSLRPGQPAMCRAPGRVTTALSTMLWAIVLAPPVVAECYSITRVGTLVGVTDIQVRDMNNAGAIVGWGTRNGIYQAFLYANGVVVSLGSLGGQGCKAEGINDAGWIVGSAATGAGEEHAFFYNAGQMIDLGTLGGSQSAATAINNSGLVVGFSTTTNSGRHLFTWQGGVRSDAGHLGQSAGEVWGVNSGGTVIGMNQLITSDLLAFSWTSAGGFQTLGTFGGAAGYPYRINDSGQIAGAVWTGQYTLLGQQIYHAFLYRNGGTTDLGTLGGQRSGATGINSSGVVVGWSDTASGQRAFIYDSSNGMRDINSLVSPTSGWVLESAVAINDAGQIAGVGRLNGQRLVYLLTPSPLDTDGDGQSDACEAQESASGPPCGNGLPISLPLTVLGLTFMRRRSS